MHNTGIQPDGPPGIFRPVSPEMIELEPEVTDDYAVEPGRCDVAGVVRFLCEERVFSEA